MDASTSSRTADHYLYLHEEKEAAVSNDHHYASSSSSPDRRPGPAEAWETAPLLLPDKVDISDGTAHQISADPWHQAGFVLATAMNSVYVLGYPGSVMVPLGWIGGTCGLLLAAAMSLYANALLAQLHRVGGKRHIRYRDLAGHIYGRKMIWLGFSTVFSLIYTVIAFVLSMRNGMTTPARDYSIPGSHSTRLFSTIGAVANLLFIYNTGMLPEIQAMLRPPVVKNTKKALWFQFTIGSLPLYAVIFMGYWAYGSSTSSYLLNNIKGPVWITAVANVSAFLQTVISLHIFANPMYEFLDTKYGSGQGSPFAIHNIMFRVLARGSYLVINTLVAAMLPFLGDFMGLTGALCTIPLTLVVANHMYLMVKRNKLSALQKCWHWLNVVGFSVFAVVATVAALRLIILDSSTYHFFADN